MTITSGSRPMISPTTASPGRSVVTVRKGFTVVSNGRLLSDVVNKDGTHTVRWSQELPASSYLASIVVAPLAKLRDSWKGHPVDYYVYQWDTTNARRLFKQTPDQIAVFSRLTGVDYPWPKYAQTTVADFFGGMENVSATTLVDWIPDPTAYLDDPWFHHELIAARTRPPMVRRLGHHRQLGPSLAQRRVGRRSWSRRTGASKRGAARVRRTTSSAKYDEFMGIDRRAADAAGRLGIEQHLSQGRARPRDAAHLPGRRALLGRGRTATWRITPTAWRRPMTSARRCSPPPGQNLDWFMDQWFYQAGYPGVQGERRRIDTTAGRRLTLNVQQTQVDSSKADSTGLRFTDARGLPDAGDDQGRRRPGGT